MSITIIFSFAFFLAFFCAYLSRVPIILKPTV
uniref:Uncharacterized protein n=1 Tax=Anguilla anguilla TaxID=7936 RepID=A0A0E9U182_ANGAN